MTTWLSVKHRNTSDVRMLIDWAINVCFAIVEARVYRLPGGLTSDGGRGE